MSNNYYQADDRFPPNSGRSNYPQQDQYQDQGEKYPLASNSQPPSSKRSKWLTVGFPILIIAIIAGAVAGGVLGSKAARDASAKSASDNANISPVVSNSSSTTSKTSSTSSSGSKTGSSTSSGSSTIAPTAAPTAGTFAVRNLVQWDWSVDKAVGICLGNWLVLERWMYEDWFIATAGPDAYDEWAFSLALGPTAAAAALKTHFNSWITEADVQQMYLTGINSIRVPLGFWAFIPVVAGEPYVECGQLGQLEKLMGWAYARNMRVLIDLHGLPGSQNGEESSGHNTTSPSWFGNPANQARSDTLVSVVMAWVVNNPYRSIITGIEVINEPRPYTAAQNVELSNYYARSYTTIQNSGYPIPMFIHPAFIANPLAYWLPFVSARVTSPPSVIYEDHPYPGNFPPQTGAADILNQVCTAAKSYLGYPVPIVITEWSVKTTAFETQFYASQATAWAFGGGGFYWSWKQIPSKLQLSIGDDYSQFSYTTLLTNTTGTIQTPASLGLTNTTTRANALAYLAGLTSNCGARPANAAPYAAAVAPTPWAAYSVAQASASTVVLRATSVPAA